MALGICKACERIVGSRSLNAQGVCIDPWPCVRARDRDLDPPLSYLQPEPQRRRELGTTGADGLPVRVGA